MIKIRIPATSANIGPGFDALGVALSMYNYIQMRESDALKIISRDGAEIPLDAENLVYKTVASLYRMCGKKFFGLELEQISNIPAARGLGSSSACIIGGLLGANEMMGRPLSQDELIDIAAVMEGHPDNSTPALMGGLVTAVLDAGKVWYVKQEIQSDLKFAVMIPDFELSTPLARSVLPKEITHMDARFNLARAALMAVSLYSGKYSNLRVASGDVLHQPYRLALIPGGGKIMEMCRENGAYAAYISGAGSSIMAIVDDMRLDFEYRVRESLVAMGLNNWSLHMLTIDNKGAVLVDD